MRLGEKMKTLKSLRHKFLTQKEVDLLPVGTKVIITWSGGNGPHKYTIHKRKGINASFVKKHNPNAGWWDGEIDFVGSERYHTRVKLVET